MKREKQIFPVNLIVVALWFLFNPNISTLDLLPDCVAYALLLAALRHLTSFVPYMRDAHDRFQTLFYISLVKIPAFFVMIMLAGERITLLLFSLSFAVLELIFLIPAVSNLFEGLFYMGQRFGCEAAIRPRGKDGPEAVRTMTYIFVITKAVLSTLPDFVFLLSFDPLTGEGISVSSTQYVFFLGIAFLISFAIGFLWLSSYALPYFRALNRDEGVRLLKPPTNSDTITRENQRFYFSLPFALFATGVCLSVDFVVDNVSVIPDFLCAAAFLALSILILLRSSRKDWLPTCLSSAFFVTTILFSVFRSRFYATYAESDLSRLPSADAAYQPVLITAILAECLFVAIVILLGIRLIRFYRENMKIPEPKNSYEKRLAAEEARGLAKQHVFILFFAALSSITTLIHLFLLKKTVLVELHPDFGGGTIYLPYSGTSWLWPLLFSLILSVLTVMVASSRVHSLWQTHDLDDDTMID